LTSLGITPVHNLPSVGQNLTDHTLVRISWQVNSADTFDESERNATIAAEELNRWNTTKTGPLVDALTNQIGWLRLSKDSFGNLTDPSAGPHSPHYEFLITVGLFKLATDYTDATLHIALEWHSRHASTDRELLDHLSRRRLSSST
jgi:hypothetical protein